MLCYTIYLKCISLMVNQCHKINVRHFSNKMHFTFFKFLNEYFYKLCEQINGLDWSLLVKHLEFEDIHNSHTYGWRCESETRVPSSRGLVKQYNQELCISLNIIKLFEKVRGSLFKYIEKRKRRCLCWNWTSMFARVNRLTIK